MLTAMFKSIFCLLLITVIPFEVFANSWIIYRFDEANRYQVTISISPEKNSLQFSLVKIDVFPGEIKESYGVSSNSRKTIPEDFIRNGIELRVNGSKTVDFKEVSADGKLSKSLLLSGDLVSKIEVYFFGNKMAEYRAKPANKSVASLEFDRIQEYKISAFDLRLFGEQGMAYSKEWAMKSRAVDNKAPPLMRVDLHTHFGGAIRASELVNIARRLNLPYPVKFLDELKIQYNRETEFESNDQKWVSIKNISPSGLVVLTENLQISSTETVPFEKMEAIYKIS